MNPRRGPREERTGKEWEFSLMASKFVKALGLGAALAAGLAFAPAAFAKDWKTVVIGMEGAFDPWNLTDSSGKIIGFEPDLVADLCKRAGLECKIIAQDWDGMIPGLKAGKFDVIMDGMSITDERKKEIDFSKPYAASPGSFLAPKDSPLAKAPEAGKLVNLDKDKKEGGDAIVGIQNALKGKTLGVQVSTTHANFANQYLKKVATIKEYKTTDDRDLDLKSGRIDASLDDLPTNMATAAKPDGKDLAVVGPTLIGGAFGVGEGMGIRKADADLTAKFDKALTAAIADGTVKALSEKWFKIDMTPR
jgi:octopine/nopaline transport system substrate-binding protein